MFGAVSCFILCSAETYCSKAELLKQSFSCIVLFWWQWLHTLHIWIQKHHFQHPLKLGFTWFPHFCTLVTSEANYGTQSPHWVLSSYRLACYQSHTLQGVATSLQVPATCWQPQTYSVSIIYLPVGPKMLGRSLSLSPPQWFYTGIHHKTGYFSFLVVSLFKKASLSLPVCSSVQMTLLPWIGVRKKKAVLSSGTSTS